MNSSEAYDYLNGTWLDNADKEKEQDEDEDGDEDGESFTKEGEGLVGRTPLAKRRRLEE